MKLHIVDIFDFKLFSKLMFYVKPYKNIYYFVMIAAILVSAFSTLTPYLLKIIIDESIRFKDFDGMVIIITMMLFTLMAEVIFQFLFVFYANLLGQNVIKDLRVDLYQKILSFKMAYFDQSAVGRLVTRAVNDVETIASIFSQGLFMIIADLLKMAVVIIIMIIINLKLSLIVFSILPLIVYATRIFQKSMKAAFEEVRFQVANWICTSTGVGLGIIPAKYPVWRYFILDISFTHNQRCPITTKKKIPTKTGKNKRQAIVIPSIKISRK